MNKAVLDYNLKYKYPEYIYKYPECILEKEMATHSSVLALRIPGTEEPVMGCRLPGCTESDTTEAT